MSFRSGTELVCALSILALDAVGVYFLYQLEHPRLDEQKTFCANQAALDAKQGNPALCPGKSR
jgi:hypothetical protein